MPENPSAMSTLQSLVQKSNKGSRANHLSRLPDDIFLADILPLLSAHDLAKIAAVCARCRGLASTPTLWLTLFQQRWSTDQVWLHQAAACRAGGWHHLWAAKHQSDCEAHPWQKPCAFEVAAVVDSISQRANPELCLCFLLDGSGSVHEEDFDYARDFIKATAEAVRRDVPGAKVAVVQFSTEAKVEFGINAPSETFETAMKDMVRINGGTNIAVALQKAGQLMKADVAGESSRCVMLITDGRVDSYQAKEARQVAEQLADEQHGVSFYAFAVGRGVDKAELLHIISAKEGGAAANRYLDLCVRDEAPW